MDRLTLLLVQRGRGMSAAFLCGLGGLVLVAWLVDPHFQIRMWGLRTMLPSTAVATLLAGFSLFLWHVPVTAHRKRGAQICGAAVAFIGLFSTIHYLAHWGLGLSLDAMFGGTWLEVIFAPKLQMALTTAISFSFAGVALCLIESKPHRGSHLEEWLAAASSILSFTTLVGHIYGVKGFIKPFGAQYSPSAMVLHTAIGLLILAFGILTARPQRGWSAYFFREGADGVIARRLLPAAILILLGLGSATEAGSRLGFYGHGFASALVTSLSAGILGLAIFQCIQALSELESSRQRAEAKLELSEERLRMALECARVGVWERDLKTNTILWSGALDDIFGLEHRSFDGRFETFLNLVHPDDRSMLQARLERVLKGSEDSYRIEYRICCPDQSVRWLAARGDVSFDREGKPVRLAGVAIDVTERKLLERELIEASGREQRRLGQDLHDDLGQWLTAVHLEARALSMFLKPISNDGSARAEKIVNWMGEVLERTRRLARGMAPAVIETAGLSEALQDLAESTERMFSARCRFTHDGKITVSNPEAALQLYRIAQEAVSNALRHGDASEIGITLELQEDGRGRLLIRDNGKGIPQPPPKGTGLGLRIMRYRAELLGADVEISTGTHGGTEVTGRFSSHL